ncbi:MAG: PQQ-binding-like beta-propeller repeat protein [Victivallales bacterium]|nr:PQQ-binding-like beta-propeller repeat protein [Victivallales bacterium]
MRKWLIALLFLLGCICLALFFRLGDDKAVAETKPSWSLVYSGCSPLGALGAYKDGFAACNAKGDLLVFPKDKEPMTCKISEYSFSAPPLEKDGIVYVGDENGIFHAFSPERGELWSYRTGNQIVGGAVVFDGLVWVGSHDHTLYAFAEENGKVMHSVDCGAQVNATPVLDEPNRTLILGSCDGKLRCISLLDGSLTGEIDLESPIPENPVLHDGIVYALSHQGVLAAVNASSFQEIYRVNTLSGCFAPPCIAGNYVFVTGENGTVQARRKSDGELVETWEIGERINTPCAVGDDTVYAVSGMGKLHRWLCHAEKWTHDVVADFQTDCRLGCHVFGNELLVPDENGGVLLYREAKP